MDDCMTQEDAMNMSNEQAIQILKPFRDMMIDQHGCPISSAVFALDKAIEALSAQPERKKGKWLDDPDGYKCSVCGAYLEIECGDGEMNFCPNCNADNRGK